MATTLKIVLKSALKIYLHRSNHASPSSSSRIVFEKCNTKDIDIEYRNHEEEKINNILKKYIQPIKQLTDNLPNHEVEIQLEFANPDDAKPQAPGKDYQKNIHPKHKGKPSYVIHQKPGHQKQANYELPRNEPHKLPSRINYPRSEHKTHLSHQGYEKHDYPRSDYQRLYFERPRMEQSKVSVLDYQRPPELPLRHAYSRPGYRHSQNNEYSRQNNAFLHTNEYQKSKYQTQSDITRYFEFHANGHQKKSAIDMKFQRPDYSRLSDHESQMYDKIHQQYAPVQPLFEQNHDHDGHDYKKRPSLSSQAQVVYVPNDNRYSMRRANFGTGIRSAIDSNRSYASTTTVASTLTAVTTPTDNVVTTSASPVPSKSPVYVEDLREILNDFVNKLHPATEAPHPSVVMPNPGSLHGNLEDIVQLIKQGLQVAKRLNVPNADKLEWLQIKLPKNLNH